MIYLGQMLFVELFPDKKAIVWYESRENNSFLWSSFFWHIAVAVLGINANSMLKFVGKEVQNRHLSTLH